MKMSTLRRIAEFFALAIMLGYTSAVVGAFIWYGSTPFNFGEPNVAIRVAEVIMGLFAVSMSAIMMFEKLR